MADEWGKTPPHVGGPWFGAPWQHRPAYVGRGWRALSFMTKPGRARRIALMSPTPWKLTEPCRLRSRSNREWPIETERSACRLRFKSPSLRALFVGCARDRIASARSRPYLFALPIARQIF